MRNVEIGSTLSVVEVTPHSLTMKGMALLGSELAIVEFTTVFMAVHRINHFFFCEGS